MQTENNFRIVKMQLLRRIHYGLQLAEEHFKHSFSLPQINYELKALRPVLLIYKETSSVLTAL